jgi:transketolase
VNLQGPVYLRISRNDLPDVMPESEPFVVGKPHLVRQGSDAVVFANGQMVSLALAAANGLADEGISLRVVNVSSMKPVNRDAVASLADGMRGVVTLEEHSLIGGLADIIRDVMQGRAVPLRAVGIQDRFGQSAHSYEDLLEGYGLSQSHIAAAVRQVVNRN